MLRKYRLPDGPPPPRPGVRHVDHRAHRGCRHRSEDDPATERAVRRVAQEQPDGDGARKEERQETEVPAGKEVPQVGPEKPQEARRVERFLHDHLVGGHPDAERVECGPLLLERERPVERLAIAPLVVQLTRDERVHPEPRRNGEGEHGPREKPGPPLPPAPRHQHRRSDEQHVQRFREGHQPENHGPGNVRPPSPQAGRRPVRVGPRDVLVEPQEIRADDPGDVEGVRAQEHRVHGHDGDGEEAQGMGQGDAPRRLRGQKQVAEQDRARQQRDLERQHAVQPRQSDERRRQHGVDVGLAVVEPVGGAPGAAPLLQEDALRAFVVDLIEALDVARLVGEIAVVGDAEGHGDVGGLVALDAVRRPHDVDGERRTAADHEQGGGRDDAGVGGGPDPLRAFFRHRDRTSQRRRRHGSADAPHHYGAWALRTEMPPMSATRRALAAALTTAALAASCGRDTPPNLAAELGAAYGALAAEAESRAAGTVAGQEGWLFSVPELRHLAGGPLDAFDPLAVILGFDRELDAHGVELLVVPVPPKAVIYADKVGVDDPLVPVPVPRLDPHHRAFYAQLRSQGVDVLDLTERFLDDRFHGEGPLYCRQDTHWSGVGCVVAAQENRGCGSGSGVVRRARHAAVPLRLADDDDRRRSGGPFRRGTRAARSCACAPSPPTGPVGRRRSRRPPMPRSRCSAIPTRSCSTPATRCTPSGRALPISSSTSSDCGFTSWPRAAPVPPSPSSAAWPRPIPRTGRRSGS